MTSNKQRIQEALAQAGASFFLRPDTIGRDPTDKRKLVIASPADRLEVELSVEPTGRQLDRLQSHYEDTGDLIKLSIGDRTNDTPIE